MKNVCSYNSEPNTNTGSTSGLVSSKKGRMLADQDEAEYIIVLTATETLRTTKYLHKQSKESVWIRGAVH